MPTAESSNLILLAGLASWLLPWLLPAVFLVGCRRKTAFYCAGVVATYFCLKVGFVLFWALLVSLHVVHAPFSGDADIARDTHRLFFYGLRGGGLAAGSLLALVVLWVLRWLLRRPVPRPAA